MNLEEMYMVLFGASRSEGAKFEIVEKWFKECEIIDEVNVTTKLYETSYDRVRDNRYDLTLVQFVELLAILARETNQDLVSFQEKFKKVKQRIVDEIQATYDD